MKNVSVEYFIHKNDIQLERNIPDFKYWPTLKLTMFGETSSIFLFSFQRRMAAIKYL